MEGLRKPISLERGGEFEEDIFGHPAVEVPFENRRYSKNEAIKLTIDFQSGEPLTENSRKLRDAIAKEMGIDTTENVEIISTLGSLVDIAFGVDGIVRFDKAYVTLDASLRDKHGEQKADMVVGPSDFDSDRNIGLLAKEISRILKSRLGDTIY